LDNKFQFSNIFFLIQKENICVLKKNIPILGNDEDKIEHKRGTRPIT
jgi:hypothetical protein